MMKMRIIIASVAMLLIVLTSSAATRGDTSGFIITGADETMYLTASASPDLPIGAVGSRFVVQSANAMRFYGMRSVTSDLRVLLEQMSVRFVIEHANGNRMDDLSYPVALVGDTLPPQVSEIAAQIIATDTVRVTWLTDEYATSIVTYGTQPAMYTQTALDVMYYKRHEITLTGLLRGNTYYFQVAGSDRSGNPYQSSEYSVSLKTFVYLPVIQQ